MNISSFLSPPSVSQTEHPAEFFLSLFFFISAENMEFSGKKVPDSMQSGVCLHKWASGCTRFTFSLDACPGLFFLYRFASVFWIIGHKGLRLSINDYETASYNFMSFLVLSKAWLCLQYQEVFSGHTTNRKHCVTHAAWLEDPALSKPL